MRHLAHLRIFPALAIFLVASAARAQDDLAFDFKMTDAGSTGGQNVNGVSTGHAVVSKGRVRLDMTGNARGMAMPGMAPGNQVTIIMPDTGKTIIYIQPKTKQYMRFNPLEAMDRMQKMMEGMGANMTFDFTGPDPKVENLGAGPVILGHQTVHYRITTGMKMNMSAGGQAQTMEMSSISDEFLAPDLPSATDPFRSIASSGASGMFGANKAYFEKLKAVQAQLPKATELRAETEVTMIGAGQMGNVKSIREITAITKTTATNDMFEAPAGYTKVEFPMGMGGAPPPGN
jgi:hypothetical protein